MSIAAATRGAFDVTAGKPDAGTRADATSPLERITAWIPTEVLGIYAGLLGIFTPDTSGSRWAVFAIGAALVPTFTIINGLLLNQAVAKRWSEEAKPGDPPKFSWSKAGLIVLLSGLAYVAWTFALPASPWLSVTDSAPEIGGAAVLILSPLVAGVASLLHLEPPQAQA